MSFRIIGGSFRNRLLKAPSGSKTRPTLAIMRKAVFDILQSEIEGAKFLDLYAGSGAMGLEALSRGASHATFVEIDRFALRSIQENCQTLKVEKESSLLCSDALLALKKLAKEGKSFEIIYVDPPYAQAHLLEKIALFIDSSSLLSEGGTLFLEEGVPVQLKTSSLPLTSLRYIDTRTFSRSTLHQFRRVS